MAIQIAIDGEMTIYRAAELKQFLLASLQRSNTLEADLSGVTELDTAGVQLLILAQAAARAKHAELRLVAPSPAIQDVFALLNLAPHFADPPRTAGCA